MGIWPKMSQPMGWRYDVYLLGSWLVTAERDLRAWITRACVAHNAKLRIRISIGILSSAFRRYGGRWNPRVDLSCSKAPHYGHTQSRWRRRSTVATPGWIGSSISLTKRFVASHDPQEWKMRLSGHVHRYLELVKNIWFATSTVKTHLWAIYDG